MLNNRSEVEGQWSLFCIEFRSRMNMYGYNNHEKLCSEQYSGKYGASQSNSKIEQGVYCCWPFHSWDSERLQTFTGLIMTSFFFPIEIVYIFLLDLLNFCQLESKDRHFPHTLTFYFNKDWSGHAGTVARADLASYWFCIAQLLFSSFWSVGIYSVILCTVDRYKNLYNQVKHYEELNYYWQQMFMTFTRCIIPVRYFCSVVTIPRPSYLCFQTLKTFCKLILKLFSYWILAN